MPEILWPQRLAYRNGTLSYYSPTRKGWKLSKGEAVVPFAYQYSVTWNELVRLGLNDVACNAGHSVPTTKTNYLLSVARSKAFADFMASVHTARAQLGSALIEMGSTVSMVNNRLGQLVQGALALRNGDLRKFLRTFGIAPKRKHQHKRWCKPSEAGGLWLEYWMGWAPTVGDIYSALAVLASNAPSYTATGRGVVKDNYSFTWGTWSNSGDWGRGKYQILASARYQAKLSCTSPNLNLLNELGLANLAQVAWQVTPFSWLLGWFVNLEQVIESWTWDFGLSVSESFTTSSLKFDGEEERKWAWSYLTTKARFHHASGSRTLGITTPSIVLTCPTRLSSSRAATLVSLLTQIGAKHASRR